jgi:hypothetical protein
MKFYDYLPPIKSFPQNLKLMSTLPKPKKSDNEEVLTRVNFNFNDLEKMVENDKEVENDANIIKINLETYEKTKGEAPDIQYPSITIDSLDKFETNQIKKSQQLDELKKPERFKEMEEIITSYSFDEKEEVDMENVTETKPSYLNIFLLNEEEILKKFGTVILNQI